MTCDEYKTLLHEYFVDRATPDDVRGLDAHRGSCRDCDRLMELALEMSCREFTDLLNDYVEGTLPPARREVLERHLSICPDCTAYLQSYRATMRMSAVSMKHAMRRLADEMPESLVQAILAAQAEERTRSHGDD